MPKVTIGMPVFNGAKTIHRALDYLLGQSFSDFELIISDNASTDDTQDICQAYAARDSRVRYVRQTTNLGAAMNFRYVLFESHTPYFMWAAADDSWAPSFIVRHLAVLESDSGIVLSQSRVLFTTNGRPMNLSTGTFALPGDQAHNTVSYLTNPADNSRYYGLFRTAALQAVFPDRNFFALDWAVAAATLRFGRHHEISDVLMIRDTTDAADYERAVARDHHFGLWRVFPLLFMTIWLLRKRLILINSATLYCLVKLNLYMHFRFGMYRWNRIAALYLGNNSLRQSVSAMLAPGLRGRIRQVLPRARQRLISAIYAVWRKLPMTLSRREAFKSTVTRMVSRRRPGTPPVRAGSSGPGQGANTPPPTRPDMPALPSSGWRLPLPLNDRTPDLSVVVVVAGNVLNALALIASLAESQHTAAADGSVELMIIDNGSVDITGALFARLPGVRYQRCAPGAPFGVAANAGTGATSGERLIFLEPTLRVEPDFLRQCLLGIGARTVIGPQLRNWDGFLDAAGGIASTSHGPRGYGAGQSGTEPAFLFARNVDYCPGAFGLRRDTLAELGGFIHDYATFEISALDIATRLKAAGGRALYWPFAIASDWSGALRQACDRIPADDHAMSAEWRLFVERNKDRIHVNEPAENQQGDRSCTRRLLFIDVDTPRPDCNAGSVLALNLIRMLSNLGFRVTFAPESNMAFVNGYTLALQALGVDAVYAPFCFTVEELLETRGREFDVVVLCRGPLAKRYMEKTRELAPQARIIFHTIDLHFLRAAREALLHCDPRMLAEAKRNEESELVSVTKADATIVVSKHEQAILRKALPDARVHVLPLLFDIPERLEARTPDHRYDIMFVGTYQHPPNRDAAIYFAREIWPLIRPRVPEARFLIVGSSLTPDIRALAGDGIEVLGFVEDLDAVMATCRLTVAPLRFGAGLKGKVASSMLAGVPVVASTIAIEGMSLRDGVEVMVADSPATFADAVVNVYRDPALWQQLAAAGFDFVRHEYAVDANIGRVLAVLADAGVAIPSHFQVAALTGKGPQLVA